MEIIRHYLVLKIIESLLKDKERINEMDIMEKINKVQKKLCVNIINHSKIDEKPYELIMVLKMMKIFDMVEIDGNGIKLTKKGKETIYSIENTNTDLKKIIYYLRDKIYEEV